MQGCWGSFQTSLQASVYGQYGEWDHSTAGLWLCLLPTAPLGRTVRDFHLTQWGLAAISMALVHRQTPVLSCTSFFQPQPVFLSLLPTIPVKVSRHTFPLPHRNVRAPHPGMSEDPRPWLLWMARPCPTLSHITLAQVSLLRHY